MENKNFTNRYEILIKIKEMLIKEIGENVSCAIVYGSTICEDFYSDSDFDILLFLKDVSLQSLSKLKGIKKELEANNINIDFNVHSCQETPQIRKECFWHNNRSLYFQTEITLYGMVLIGESPFFHNNFEKDELKKECVRVINSLLYQTRKLFLNKELTSNKRIQVMKWCIYSVLYALAFKGVITKTKTEALEIFSEYYILDTDPLEFLNAKVENNVTDLLIEKAYNFLQNLDDILFKEFMQNKSLDKTKVVENVL